MSLIFTGLSRLRSDNYEGEEQELIFPEGEDIAYGIKERQIHCHTILTEEFPSLRLFNTNQQFVLYAQKNISFKMSHILPQQ